MLLLKTPLCYKLTFVSHSYVEMQTNKQIMEALTQNTKKPHKKHWNLATFWNEMSCFLHTFLICKPLCFCVCVSGVTHNVLVQTRSHAAAKVFCPLLCPLICPKCTLVLNNNFLFFMSLPFFIPAAFYHMIWVQINQRKMISWVWSEMCL